MDLQEFWNLVEPGKASEEPEASLKSGLQNQAGLNLRPTTL